VSVGKQRRCFLCFETFSAKKSTNRIPSADDEEIASSTLVSRLCCHGRLTRCILPIVLISRCCNWTLLDLLWRHPFTRRVVESSCPHWLIVQVNSGGQQWTVPVLQRQVISNHSLRPIYLTGRWMSQRWKMVGYKLKQSSSVETLFETCQVVWTLCSQQTYKLCNRRIVTHLII
jgi:hypothetical protein